jgi:predicted HicB family RNase H-like nuclease
VQLVFQASLLRKVKEEAVREGTSVNELVHIALREYLAAKEVQ